MVFYVWVMAYHCLIFFVVVARPATLTDRAWVTTTMIIEQSYNLGVLNIGNARCTLILNIICDSSCGSDVTLNTLLTSDELHSMKEEFSAGADPNILPMCQWENVESCINPDTLEF